MKRTYSARNRERAGLDSVRYRRIDKRKGLKSRLKVLQTSIAQMRFPIAFIINPDLELATGERHEGQVVIVQCDNISGLTHTTKDLAKEILGFFYPQEESIFPVKVQIDTPGILNGVLRPSPARSKEPLATGDCSSELTHCFKIEIGHYEEI